MEVHEHIHHISKVSKGCIVCYKPLWEIDELNEKWRWAIHPQDWRLI